MTRETLAAPRVSRQIGLTPWVSREIGATPWVSRVLMCGHPARPLEGEVREGGLHAGPVEQSRAVVLGGEDGFECGHIV